uniref:Tripartite motif-containing protein 39 n=1 Tax=Anas platyrhynchos TaxID=8839 RepID=A0A8B9TP24_ANAPL
MTLNPPPEEAICSICLEYMTEPVSVDCGHNFCHGCITKHCQEKCLWNDAPFSCPQCRAPCRRSSLRPNRQLANIVESIRQLRLGGGVASRDPTLYPETVKKKRERIVSEFGKLHRLLAAEEKLLLQKLEEEEKQILVMISESMFRLVEQKSLLDELILEIKEKMHLPDEGLLKVRLCLQPSNSSPTSLEHSSMLVADTQPAHEVRLSFLPSLTPVDVTLDPETAHPDLILSEDHKSVRRGGRKLLLSFFDNTRRFNSAPVVLGVQFFFSGRHYWEVHVGDKPEWGLGLCKEAASRKGNILFSPNNGYWVLRLQNGGNYEALTCPVSHLTLSIRPRCIGIFLDYEAGEISFYNVTDRSHLYTFTDKFSGKTLLKLGHPLAATVLPLTHRLLVVGVCTPCCFVMCLV